MRRHRPAWGEGGAAARCGPFGTFDQREDQLLFSGARRGARARVPLSTSAARRLCESAAQSSPRAASTVAPLARDVRLPASIRLLKRHSVKVISTTACSAASTAAPQRRQYRSFCEVRRRLTNHSNDCVHDAARPFSRARPPAAGAATAVVLRGFLATILRPRRRTSRQIPTWMSIGAAHARALQG
jgi:hypothetical protein